MIHLVLQAGTNLLIKDKTGKTPLAYFQSERPSYLTAIAFLEQVPDAEKAHLIIKARRLVVAATSTRVVPLCLQRRIARGQPLPCVALLPETDGRNEGKHEEDHTFRSTLAFLLGLEGGPGGGHMRAGVFVVVLDMLMPSWDPLRHGVRQGPPPRQFRQR